MLNQRKASSTEMWHPYGNFPILVKEYMTIKKKLKMSIKSAILQYEHKLANDKKIKKSCTNI